MNFKKWFEQYSCAGMSLNADFWWDEHQEFLTTRGYKQLANILVKVCKETDLQVTDHKLLSYQGQTNPEYGFSYMLVLDQSHIMVHTWPEHNMMNIDVFTCGDEGNPGIILNALTRELKPKDIQKNQMARGIRKDVKNANEKPDSPKDLKSI